VLLSSTALTFASQTVGTQSPLQRLTLTNSGSATLSISGIAARGDFRQQNNCGMSLAAGAKCSIMVAFNPRLGGIRSGSLTVSSNAAGSPNVVSLTGIGVFLTLSPSAVTFNGQAINTIRAPQVVTLGNVTTLAGRVVSIRIAGPNTLAFTQTTTCGTSLAAGASCTVSVKFAPKFKGGQTATLEVAGGGTNLSTALTGTGK